MEDASVALSQLQDGGLHNGDRVGLIDDDWSFVGQDIFLVDIEPVPGSTQCVVRTDGETRTVSRAQLRLI